MKIVSLPLSEIKPYPNNPRKNDGAVDAVAESIKQCGYCAPIVIDEDGIILAGHTRLKALKKLGYKSADVVVRDGLTEEQKRKYRLLDNKTGEVAEWDTELLQKELEGLDFQGFDFGFESEMVEPDAAKEDNYNPVLPNEPKSKIGDVYVLGRHRLMCGDSTVISDVEKLMNGTLADVMITDPPYNVSYKGKAGTIKNDNMQDAQFRQFLTDAFKCATMVMKPGAAFYIWHADTEGYNFRGACIDAGLKARQCLIWVKNRLVLGRQDYQWKHEPCLYGEKEIIDTIEEENEDHQPCIYGWVDGRHYWFRNRKQTTVLEFQNPLHSKEHPTMKPVPLFDYQIRGNAKIGESVLDLFAGSGTTIIACEQNERNAFCMELDPKY